MPTITSTHSGSSLRDRLDQAARLTAEQRAAKRVSAVERPKGNRDKNQKGQPAPKGRKRAAERGAAAAGTFLQSPGKRVALIVVVAIALFAAMLYPVAQTYYQSMRQEQRLEAQVSAVNARNDALGQENKDLQTDEGIEDAAREQGYVQQGDSAAIVTNAGQDASRSSEMPGKVDVDSIEAPHTWYYDILDALFFVQYD